MWDLIVSVPDHCLSFYLVDEKAIIRNRLNRIPHPARVPNGKGTQSI